MPNVHSNLEEPLKNHIHVHDCSSSVEQLIKSVSFLTCHSKHILLDPDTDELIRSVTQRYGESIFGPELFLAVG